MVRFIRTKEQRLFHVENGRNAGAPERTRTSDLRFRKPGGGVRSRGEASVLQREFPRSGERVGRSDRFKVHAAPKSKGCPPDILAEISRLSMGVQ